MIESPIAAAMITARRWWRMKVEGMLLYLLNDWSDAGFVSTDGLSIALADADRIFCDWKVFGVQQTGQLLAANGRTADVIGVGTACERRDAEAVREINRPWYQRLLS